MKKLIFTFLLMLLAVSASFAQERIITEVEFNEILNKTTEQLKNINYRLTKTEELFLKAGENPE